MANNINDLAREILELSKERMSSTRIEAKAWLLAQMVAENEDEKAEENQAKGLIWITREELKEYSDLKQSSLKLNDSVFNGDKGDTTD